ncbi:hypothetical protein N0V90_006353 [Kalmusia sp. IMI 367209]|nr:hypothetical protein N0V90_006353 [Kalmusia sp. IMI 367209]
MLQIANYSRTMRWPTSHDSDAKPQVGEWQKGYLASQIQRQNDIHGAFQHTALFNEFSAVLENAHGVIHVVTGGEQVESQNDKIRGHMWDPEYSAFDPVFMLHHASIDRLLALYTAANPDVWLEPLAVNSVNNIPNFWIPPNAVTDANYPLPPFWKDEQTFYNSEDVRSTDALGYAYPETQHWNFASADDWQNDVRSTIQRLYPNNVQTTLTNAILSGSELSSVVEEGDMFTDWTIEARASVAEMPSTFQAKFSFTGDFSSDESTQVGMWPRMMPESHEPDAWKVRQAERKARRGSTPDQSSSSTIALTSSLLDRIAAGKLENLSPDAVVPYLKNHLTWTVYAVGLLSKDLLL